MEVLNYNEFKVTDAMLASSGKRFANSLIDGFAFYVLLIIIILLLSLIQNFVSVDLLGFLDSPLYFLVVYTVLLLYYTILEYKLGKTIGKIITKTKVVFRDGNSITFEKALYRSLSRLVPFEAFSFLGTPSRGWHDTWTETYVVDEKIFEEQKEQFYNFKELGIEKND